MLYDEVLNEIVVKKDRKERGMFNGIPFPFVKYQEFYPSIDKGHYLQILGATGQGKSKFKRFLMYKMIDFAMGSNYPLKILDFSLEDYRTEVYKQIMIHYLHEKYQVDLSKRYLNSVDHPLNDKYIELIKNEEKFWKTFEDYVWIINDATSPNEIEKTCLKVHERYGKTHHIVALIDNYANITRDSEDSDEWSAVKRLSRNIIRLNLCKTKKMSVIAVLQQDFDSDRFAFRNAGKGSILQLEPNLSSVGDNKVITRDAFVVFALFNPVKYDIESYPNHDGYNIKILKDKFRSLLMLKSNLSEIAPRLGLLFDGKYEIFSTLPFTTDKEALDKIYRDVIQQEEKKVARIQGKLI
jgi:hypothetical protein